MSKARRRPNAKTQADAEKVNGHPSIVRMEADLADCPALTSHVLFEYMRPNTSVTYHTQDAKNRWLAAEPGTLYL